MKKLVVLLLITVMMTGMFGCGTSTESNSDVITVVDHAGYEVEVPKDIQRIVVCDIYPLPSVLAIFFDSAEKLVGIADQSMTAAKSGLLSELYPEILNAETGFIEGTNINIEEIMKLNPDVVFYSAETEQIGTQLREAGFAAIGVSAGKWDYDAIETLNNWILLLSEMFPENDKTELVQQYSQDKYDFVQSRVADIPEGEREKLFFLFQYNDTMITTSGKKFFGQWWADAVGAVNVGEEMETAYSTQVNLEQVYTWNPDRILITNFNAALPDDLYNNTIGSYDWSGINAVENGKVNKMPLGMYRSYTCGVDTPVTLMWIAKTVYPEIFADVDITQETKDYYKAVFNIELTDEQAEKIFAPSKDAAAFK